MFSTDLGLKESRIPDEVWEQMIRQAWLDIVVAVNRLDSGFIKENININYEIRITKTILPLKDVFRPKMGKLLAC